MAFLTALGKSKVKKYYNDENFYNLIWSNANSNPYFLATRQVNISTNTSGIDYELNYVGIALEPGLAFSNGSNSETRLGIRPIVPIGQDVIIYGGDGTEAHPYQLKL